MTPPATCILTGTIENPPGSPVAGALVRARTIAPQLLSNGAGSVVNDLTVYTAADGTFALTLARGLYAQLDIDELGLAKDIQIPDLATVALSALTLYNRGTLTPATIISAQGPSMGGDLTGASPNPSVVALRGVPLYPESPSNGDVWVYRSADGAFRAEPFPVTAAVQGISAGQGIAVTGPTTGPTVAVANGGIVAAMLATGAAVGNVGSLGGALSGTLPAPSLANDAVTDAKVAAGAAIAWAKVSKVGAVASDVGAMASGAVIASINASVESPKIANAQLQDIAQSKVTNLVADLAAKRNSADAIPQADVTGLVAALASKEATANKGVAGGYAALDGGGRVPAAQLPTTVLADGDKGDVTVSGSGTVFAIDAKAVTYSKMQDVSTTDRLLGRATAGSGVVEEIPLTAAGRALIDDVDAAAQRATLALGTAATRNVPAAGNAAVAEVVKGDDTRLADARTPLTHAHAEADVTGLVADLAARVPTTRTVSTTAPLAGGGDLSANRTLSVTDATTLAVGVVRLTGDLGGTGASPTVVAVGGQTAANVAAGAVLANAATELKTNLAIVRRSATGAAALDVTGNVTGNVTGTAANVTGVVAVANGGTGQAVALDAFDALCPTSAKGDLVGHNGSVSVRVPVGSDGNVPIADSAQAVGWRWGAPVGTGSVTSVATGNGLQGGPITGVGTVDLRLAATGGLSKVLGAGVNELGIATGGVADAMLATPKANTARLISTTAPLTGGGDLSADRTLAVSGATAGARGVLALAGDLAGTADVPTVATVGGKTAAAVATSVNDTIAATAAATPSTIVKRDASGNTTVVVLTASSVNAGSVTADDLYVNADATIDGNLNVNAVTARVTDTGGQVFNVVGYGTIGNGVNDDTGAINAAIAAASAGGVIFFPPGTYKYTTLTLSVAGLEFRGAGANATTLRTTTTGGTAISITAAGCALRDLKLDLLGTGVAPQKLVNVTGGATFERVTFSDWHTGISMTGPVVMRDCSFVSPELGALVAMDVGFNGGLDASGVNIGSLSSRVVTAKGLSVVNSPRETKLDGCGVFLSGNGTALYGQFASYFTANNSIFVGAGTGYAIDSDNCMFTLNGCRAWGGMSALYEHEQSYLVANDTVFNAFDYSESNAAQFTVFLDMDGTAVFSNVIVGAPAAGGYSCVRGENASAYLRWDGGRLNLVNGVATAAYGISWDAVDVPHLSNIDSYGTPTTALFGGGALATTVASASTISPPARVTHVTGVAAIATIAKPLTSDPIILIPDGAFSFTTLGNIAVAMTAAVGVPIMLVYDDVTTKWYPTRPIAGATALTDGALVIGNGANNVKVDSDLFYDATNKRLGVAQGAPLATLHVSQDGASEPQAYFDAHGTLGGIIGRTSAGTKASPSAVSAGYQLAGLGGRGYGVSTYGASDAGSVTINANQTFTESARGSYVDIKTTPNNATSPVTAIRVHNDGKVCFGSKGLTTPIADVDITGNLAYRLAQIALVNGLNSNINTSIPASFIRLTSVTAVFSIGGFTRGADGVFLVALNPNPYAMTIVNEDASSTAANRITTLTGANVVLRAGQSAATFIYDVVSSRWILVSTN